jgi:uncharacterized protein YwgA
VENRINRLNDFTSGLVKVFEIRQGLLGKVDCQKTAYFMKRLGVDVPFSFRWNIFGPYSYDLAHYCNYLEIEGLIEYSGTYSLNKERAKLYPATLKADNAERLRRFFTKVKEICEAKGYDKVLFLECAASLDFIRMNALKKMANKQTIFTLLEKLKPQRTSAFREIREDCWNLLKEEGLI